MAGLLPWIFSKLTGRKPNNPSLSPTMRSFEQFDDSIVGWELNATLAPTTPLSVLLRHREVRREIDDSQKAINPHFVWIPKMDSQYDYLKEGATMSSAVGYMPLDGGPYLPFLIELRHYIESPIPGDVAELDQVKIRAGWICEMAGKYPRKFMGNREWAYDLVFSETIRTPHAGIQTKHVRELQKAGYKTVREILEAPDQVLLGISGIGPARLQKIRANLNQ